MRLDNSPRPEPDGYILLFFSPGKIMEHCTVWIISGEFNYFAGEKKSTLLNPE